MKIKTEIEFEIKTIENGGRYSCFIPEFNLLFSAKNKDDIKRKAEAMIKMSLEFNNEYNIENLYNKEKWK